MTDRQTDHVTEKCVAISGIAFARALSLFSLYAVDLSGEWSAAWVLCLHSAPFFTSTKLSRKSSMLCLTTSIHLFLCLPLLRCPRTSFSKICLTQSSSSRRCIFQIPRTSLQNSAAHHDHSFLSKLSSILSKNFSY